MSNSKHEILGLVGVVGAGVAAAILLRRALREEPAGEAPPTMKLPKGAYFSVQALWQLGTDSFQYGVGRWILQSVKPSDGIGSLTLFGQESICLRDPELVQEVLRQNHQAGGGYGKSFLGSPFDPIIDQVFGRGLFFAEDFDPQWQAAHKVLSRPFSHRGVVGFIPLMCEQADKLVAALERDAAGGKPVYIYEYLVKMALDTVACCSMGTYFNSFESEAPHPFPVAFQDAVDALFDLVGMPSQLWWVCFRAKAKMRRAVGRMNAIIDDVVQRRMRGETRSSGKAPDLLDIMLDREGGSELSAENIRSQILTFLFAGHDSTAAAMSTLTVLLLANPRVQAKVVAEIQRVVGSGELEAGHLPQLTYLDWCLREALRLVPPAASYQRMAFRDDLLLGGRWRVERWAPVLIDIFTLHLDPETWGPDAARFVPERWEAGPPHPCSYMPFASGPRGCIGKEFSLIEQKVVAVKLLQRFRMRCPETWSPRKGCVLIKASESPPQPKLGIDAEFNPLQFFVGASVPVELERRSLAAPAAAGGGA